MRTAVRRVLLMSALMSPGALYALGLGEIHLNSALNQPFDADIELVSATQEDLGALRAALASSDTFVRYGLDRPAYLSDFSFRVAKGAGGKDVLRVTSPRPVTEPFVTLLVEANWPRGRLLREYTVLLDPPVFAPGPATGPEVAAPKVTSGGATSARSSEPVAEATAEEVAPTPTPRASGRAAPSGVEPGGTYKVRPNDTLYQIASAANPGSRSNVNRAMVAIYQGNPTAFEGNINLLRSGSTLRIPDRGEVEAVSAAAASAEVARQYEAWRGGTSAPAAESGRLRLVTPEQGTAAPSTTVPGAKPAATPAATTASSAAPAASAAANADLSQRIDQLEKELQEAKRLLEVRNAELATMQGGAATAQPPVAPAETPPAEASAPEATPATATPAAEEPKAADKPAKPKKPKKTVAKEPAGPSLLDRLGDYWMLLLGLVVAGVGFALFRKVRRERGSAEDNLEEALASRDLRTPGPTYTPRSRDGEIVVEEKRALEPTRTAAPVVAPVLAAAAATPRAPEPNRKPVSIEDTMSGEQAVNIESGDPLAEADFHMAYGLYDQAADLVQLAIKREPQRRDLQLKLLEIYFVWGNRDKFMQLARELNATRGEAPSGEWDKVLIMGKQMAPEDPMFAAGTTSSVDSLDMELHGDTGTLDMDISGGLGGNAPDIDLSQDETEIASRSGIDFILDEPLRGLEEAQLSPTIETPRVVPASAGDTQEVTVDALGLEVESLRALGALDQDEDLVSTSRMKVEDTVETPAAIARGAQIDPTIETPAASQRNVASDEPAEDAEDLLNSTSMIRMLESTALMEMPDAEGIVDLTESTGEMPSLDSSQEIAQLKTSTPDYDLSSEPATMSEVGTKLDLARAYMDMGDPEGARSILDEVLQEGNSAQRQEAERLIANLP